jgi:hypothetical protein
MAALVNFIKHTNGKSSIMDGFTIKASIQSVVFSHLGALFQVGNWTNIFINNKHVSGGISHKWVKVWLVIIIQQLTGIEMALLLAWLLVALVLALGSEFEGPCCLDSHLILSDCLGALETV